MTPAPQHHEDPGPLGSCCPKRTGVSSFCRRVVTAAATAAVVLSLLALAGCGEPPEAFPARMEAALRSGDKEAVRALLSRDSRAMLDTLWDAPHPEGRQPFAMHPPQRPTQLKDVLRQSSDLVVLRVNDGEGDGEWVLRHEAGGWRLDLAATASRRPFLGL